MPIDRLWSELRHMWKVAAALSSAIETIPPRRALLEKVYAPAVGKSMKPPNPGAVNNAPTPSNFALPLWSQTV